MKIQKKKWEGFDIFDRVSVGKAIPVDAKDGLIDIKWSENDRGYLVVFAPGSKKDVNEALNAFKKCGWSTEYETYKGYHVVCVRDKEWDGLTDESKEKPSPISIEEQERQKETRKVMNHLMNAEDEIYTAMTSAQRMAKYENNQATANSLNICASYSETALKNLSGAKLAIRDLKMNESTKKLVKEGAGAGYDIIINDVKIDKVLKFEESDYKSEYSREKWYRYEASIKPGIHEIEANTYYDALTSEDDNQVTIESGTIYGEVGIWEDPDDERTLEEKIREEIEGSAITISTMYG